MAELRSPYVADLPRFTGGAVGYLGYDAAAWFEPVTLQQDEPGLSDALRDEAAFMLFDTVLAFDHVKHRILIIANARITPDDDLGALYQFACAKIDFLESELRRDLSLPARNGSAPIAVRSNVSREQFLKMVETARHIAAGEIYRAVSAFRDRDPRPILHGTSAQIRQPFALLYFSKMGQLAIVVSPEMLVRVEGRADAPDCRTPARPDRRGRHPPG